jgi:hypothetical protein
MISDSGLPDSVRPSKAVLSILKMMGNMLTLRLGLQSKFDATPRFVGTTVGKLSEFVQTPTIGLATSTEFTTSVPGWISSSTRRPARSSRRTGA